MPTILTKNDLISLQASEHLILTLNNITNTTVSCLKKNPLDNSSYLKYQINCDSLIQENSKILKKTQEFNGKLPYIVYFTDVQTDNYLTTFIKLLNLRDEISFLWNISSCLFLQNFTNDYFKMDVSGILSPYKDKENKYFFYLKTNFLEKQIS